MPVLERDPWRLQYFENIPCPDNVLIPTDDPDSWNLYPAHRWIYDKLKIAGSQGLTCGPHGVMPPSFPVFSKPIVNLKGMGIGSAAIHSAAELDRLYQPGHFWMPLLEGRHISTDCAVIDGRVRWLRHSEGKPFRDGMFDFWTIHAAAMPDLEAYLGGWLARHLQGYTGIVNFETIGGVIIEAHLRFTDQWCDLNGAGWIEALAELHSNSVWNHDDSARRDGYSFALFARHGPRYDHPQTEHQSAIRAMPGVASLQITFHQRKPPEDHPMPPGGFRLGIVNAWSIEDGRAARRKLAETFPAEAILWPPD
jgi:hypothetical protein